MTDAYDKQIEEFHRQLYVLYRAGSRDYDKIEGLWARIERLEAHKTVIRGGSND